jgi:hypothetical protein
MNPATLGWYLPLLVRDIPGALQPSESRESFTSPDHGSEDDAQDKHSEIRLHPFAIHRGRQSKALVAGRSKGKMSRDTSWEDLDAKFRRDLPNDSYLERLSYRGMVMRGCPKVGIIDGVRVSSGERIKAEQYLDGILRARREAAGK